MPEAGLEPARCLHRGILNPLRLPIPPFGQVFTKRKFSNETVAPKQGIYGIWLPKKDEVFFRKEERKRSEVAVCAVFARTAESGVLRDERLPIPPFGRLAFQTFYVIFDYFIKWKAECQVKVRRVVPEIKKFIPQAERFFRRAGNTSPRCR